MLVTCSYCCICKHYNVETVYISDQILTASLKQLSTVCSNVYILWFWCRRQHFSFCVPFSFSVGWWEWCWGERHWTGYAASQCNQIKGELSWSGRNCYDLTLLVWYTSVACSNVSRLCTKFNLPFNPNSTGTQSFTSLKPIALVCTRVGFLLPYSWKLSRRKHSQIAHLCCAKGHHTLIFHRENFH